MGYSLGKAQEITRILTDAGLPVTAHGAVRAMNALYEQHGAHVGPTRPYAAADFHGKNAVDLAERGVLVAPPQVARSGFTTKFERSCKIMMSGWALNKGAQYRYGVDHALPLSDHADFDELLELIEESCAIPNCSFAKGNLLAKREMLGIELLQATIGVCFEDSLSESIFREPFCSPHCSSALSRRLSHVVPSVVSCLRF